MDTEVKVIIWITGLVALIFCATLIILIIVAAINHKRDMGRVAKRRHPDNIRRKWGEAADTGTIPTTAEIDAFLQQDMYEERDRNPEASKIVDLIQHSNLSDKEKLLLAAHTVRDLEEGLI